MMNHQRDSACPVARVVDGDVELHRTQGADETTVRDARVRRTPACWSTVHVESAADRRDEAVAGFERAVSARDMVVDFVDREFHTRRLGGLEQAKRVISESLQRRWRSQQIVRKKPSILFGHVGQ